MRLDIELGVPCPACEAPLGGKAVFHSEGGPMRTDHGTGWVANLKMTGFELTHSCVPKVTRGSGPDFLN
jgi:hypothetical protein